MAWWNIGDTYSPGVTVVDVESEGGVFSLDLSDGRVVVEDMSEDGPSNDDWITEAYERACPFSSRPDTGIGLAGR
jgi:hypothetical protein